MTSSASLPLIPGISVSSSYPPASSYRPHVRIWQGAQAPVEDVVQTKTYIRLTQRGRDVHFISIYHWIISE